MKMTKKINAFIAALLFATTFNTYTMKNELIMPQWVTRIGKLLLNDNVSVEKLLEKQDELFASADLSKDIQENIITLLHVYITAPTLTIAAETIDSLASVNYELDQLINAPKFCLSLIKHLAIKLNHSDEVVGATLHIPEAQRISLLQNKFFALCNTPEGEKKLSFGDLSEQGVDLNFTYNLNAHHFYTPLMIAIYSGSIRMVNLLLKTTGKNKVDIDKRDSAGNTALMLSLTHAANPIIIQLLLKAGANPELANFNGLTPRAAALQTGDQRIINWVMHAILMKNSAARAA